MNSQMLYLVPYSVWLLYWCYMTCLLLSIYSYMIWVLSHCRREVTLSFFLSFLLPSRFGLWRKDGDQLVWGSCFLLDAWGVWSTLSSASVLYSCSHTFEACKQFMFFLNYADLWQYFGNLGMYVMVLHLLLRSKSYLVQIYVSTFVFTSSLSFSTFLCWYFFLKKRNNEVLSFPL